MSSPIWIPTHPEQTHLYAFQQFLAKRFPQACGSLQDYAALHQWSVKNFPAFWESLAAFLKLPFQSPCVFKKTGPALWQNKWFEGAQFNVTQQLLRGEPEQLALIAHNERQERHTWTYQQLTEAVHACAAGLQQAGVRPQDRVVAVMPNVPETIIAMLATAQLGAMWASCSPEFGAAAIVDKFSQLSPTVLFLCDGVQYNGSTYPSQEKLSDLCAGLPTLTTIVWCPVIQVSADYLPTPSPLIIDWQSFLIPNSIIDYQAFPVDHPLYVMFSSGTTGKPKCIVHAAGTTLMQHMKELHLHCDLDQTDNLFFYTTCGWMMWNWMVSGLSLGMCLTLYDGSPLYPKPERLFSIIAQEKVSAFGTSAKYLAALAKTGCRPSQHHDLSALQLILSTGSPLLPAQYEYVYAHIQPSVQLSSISGGTDILSCFALGNPMLPVYRGELQCLGLGLDVQVFNALGQAVTQEKGELVCTQPFPSMPLKFWNDPANERYQHAYFERFAGVWTHGDFAEITSHQGLIIYGRSDTTLNPGGVRIGPAEIYREIEQMPEIIDSVVIGQPWQEDVRLLLFVQLKPPHTLSPLLKKKICERLKKNASPRHVPAMIVAVPDIPKTHNGKIVEIAIRQLIEGKPIQNLEAIANPEALQYFHDLAIQPT